MRTQHGYLFATPIPSMQEFGLHSIVILMPGHDDEDGPFAWPVTTDDNVLAKHPLASSNHRLVAPDLV